MMPKTAGSWREALQQAFADEPQAKTPKTESGWWGTVQQAFADEPQQMAQKTTPSGESGWWAGFKQSFKSGYSIELRQLLLLAHLAVLACLVLAVFLPGLRELFAAGGVAIGFVWLAHIPLLPLKGPDFVLSEKSVAGWLGSYITTSGVLAGFAASAVADWVAAWLTRQLLLGLPLAG